MPSFFPQYGRIFFICRRPCSSVFVVRFFLQFFVAGDQYLADHRSLFFTFHGEGYACPSIIVSVFFCQLRSFLFFLFLAPFCVCPSVDQGASFSLRRTECLLSGSEFILRSSSPFFWCFSQLLPRDPFDPDLPSPQCSSILAVADLRLSLVLLHPLPPFFCVITRFSHAL